MVEGASQVVNNVADDNGNVVDDGFVPYILETYAQTGDCATFAKKKKGRRSRRSSLSSTMCFAARST
jgi:hypothetical protein